MWLYITIDCKRICTSIGSYFVVDINILLIFWYAVVPDEHEP